MKNSIFFILKHIVDDKFPDLKIWQNMPKHLGSHSGEYEKYISKKLDGIMVSYKLHNNSKRALKEVEKLVIRVIEELETGNLKLNK